MEVVHIRDLRFRPFAAVIQPGKELRIVLEPAHRAGWTVEACPNAPSRDRQAVLDNLGFSIPRTANVGRHHSEDASSEPVFLSKHLPPIVLVWAAIGGPNVHDAYWILNSIHFEEAWVRDTSDRILGMDSRGETRDGSRWRSVALWNVTASYDGIPADVVGTFDSLINSACLRRSPRKARLAIMLSPLRRAQESRMPVPPPPEGDWCQRGRR